MDYRITFEGNLGYRIVKEVDKIITYEGFIWFKDLSGYPLFAKKAIDILEIELVEEK
jgi:hypothetical protein